MKITDCRINHMVNPLGYEFRTLTASWKVTEARGRKQAWARIRAAKDRHFQTIVFDTGKDDSLCSTAAFLGMETEPETRYYWTVEVMSDEGETAVSEINWFETAIKPGGWKAKWIGPERSTDRPVELRKEFSVSEEIMQARLYITGLGVYECEINGRKAGEEYLTPYCNNYRKWIQYQTFDVTGLVEKGKNCMKVLLGDGWYKGRFAPDWKPDHFGSEYKMIAELHIEYRGGSREVIGTDGTWNVRESEIQWSNIYDGEAWEPGNAGAWEAVKIFPEETAELSARASVPVRIQEEKKPVEVIRTPKGETVLDFGQNMAGFVRFRCRERAKTKIRLQYGEILQNGCFYRENLRSAKAEYHYVSDGKERLAEPKFTYYGFRYVKLEGFSEPVRPEDFTACVLYSDMVQTGSLKTSNAKVNRLIRNVLWGQKSNFVDVPTDCPQRDERLGWTGDARVFAATACYQMGNYPFYAKYLKDMYAEQIQRDGAVPNVVPAFTMDEGISSFWGDAATVIPWTLYQFYGDRQILSDSFASMRAWVDYIRSRDEASGGHRLWTTDFHFGDWLALDSETGTNVKGGTDEGYIASVCYYDSARIVAKAARILGYGEETKIYGALAEEILQAIREEYVTQGGRLAVTTQTAYVLALRFGVVEGNARVKAAEALRDKIEKNQGFLKTGFIGTSYLCPVLSENGCNDLAYGLLLNEEYPGWLYAVNLGATTVWERWNSVLPDGTISGTGMNSLNHYSYGAVLEWMYRYAAGLQPIEEYPGFQRVRIAPKPDYRLPKVDMTYDSAAGIYRISWEIMEDGKFVLDVEIPFGAAAELKLPNLDQEPEVLEAGKRHYEYKPEKSFLKVYGLDSTIGEIKPHADCAGILKKAGVALETLPDDLDHMALSEFFHTPFVHLDDEDIRKLSEQLGKYQVTLKNQEKCSSSHRIAI